MSLIAYCCTLKICISLLLICHYHYYGPQSSSLIFGFLHYQFFFCVVFFQHEVELLDPRGRTPLHLSVTLGNLESARVLLRHGANANAENKGYWSGNEFHIKSVIQVCYYCNKRILFQIILCRVLLKNLNLIAKIQLFFAMKSVTEDPSEYCQLPAHGTLLLITIYRFDFCVAGFYCADKPPETTFFFYSYWHWFFKYFEQKNVRVFPNLRTIQMKGELYFFLLCRISFFVQTAIEA